LTIKICIYTKRIYEETKNNDLGKYELWNKRKKKYDLDKINRKYFVDLINFIAENKSKHSSIVEKINEDELTRGDVFFVLTDAQSSISLKELFINYFKNKGHDGIAQTIKHGYKGYANVKNSITYAVFDPICK
jgi:hypothetical protein